MENKLPFWIQVTGKYAAMWKCIYAIYFKCLPTLFLRL